MENIYILLIIMVAFSILIKVIEPGLKGKVGEATVSMLLQRLDKDNYKVINDVLLRTASGNTGTTQIDHVVVSIYGLFSIETKNYKGQIYGSESSSRWTQNIYGHKYSFMNPIHQNYAHVKALETLLQNNGYSNIPIYSIIAFPGDTTLKVMVSKAIVVKWGAVTGTIKKLSNQYCLSKDDVEIISVLLAEQESVRFEMQKHVSEIQKVKTQKKQKIESGMCPRCGGTLILRNGKYGKFYGCSNYPKCRFTVQQNNKSGF